MGSSVLVFRLLVLFSLFLLLLLPVGLLRLFLILLTFLFFLLLFVLVLRRCTTDCVLLVGLPLKQASPYEVL
eukprot:s1415_g5.t1